MREINFRAWDKTKKRMTRGFAIGPYGDLHTWDGKIGGFSRTHGNRANSFKVMQFTGLLDCHGKEIYFDDVVKIRMYDDTCDAWNTGTALIVESLNKGVGILFEMDDEGKSYGIHAVAEGGMIEELWEDEQIFNVEVIGNIYENPELINH